MAVAALASPLSMDVYGWNQLVATPAAAAPRARDCPHFDRATMPTHLERDNHHAGERNFALPADGFMVALFTKFWEIYPCASGSCARGVCLTRGCC